MRTPSSAAGRVAEHGCLRRLLLQIYRSFDYGEGENALKDAVSLVALCFFCLSVASLASIAAIAVSLWRTAQ